MQKQISSGLKNTFLAHFIAAMVFTIIYLVIPETFANLVNWPLKEPLMYRLLGAAVFSLGVASWLAYKETVFEKVKIVLVMEIVWCSLGTLIYVWGILSAAWPTINWVSPISMALFAAAFGFFYFKK